MVTRKNHNERYNEILDAGEVLFTQKGYEKTTVNDILDYVGIGKGTFYHYFKSKEEVMDAMIMRVVHTFESGARIIVDDKTLSAEEKFARIVMGDTEGIQDMDAMIKELHQVENAKMHQKSITETIIALAPILTDVVKQGIKEGVFKTPYPQETVEILLVANQFFFDRGVFVWKPEEFIQKVEAFVYSLEILLGAKSGSFNYLLEHYKSELEGVMNENI